jgi:hypothetical protein
MTKGARNIERNSNEQRDTGREYGNGTVPAHDDGGRDRIMTTYDQTVTQVQIANTSMRITQTMIRSEKCRKLKRKKK